MKTILTTMAALSAIAVAAPATAQNYPYQQGGYGNRYYQNGADANFAGRIGRLQMRLDAGVQSGTISRRDAASLRQQLDQLSRLERQYSRNGLNQQERQTLRQRLQMLRQQIRTADRGNQGRWDAYDREDGYGQYERDERYGQNGRYERDERMDRNNDGYDDRDYDRDGRWDDDARNEDYRQPAQSGGLGGIIQSVLGIGGLRVGQRAPDNLGGVPYEYRDQFRDGNGTYFRSDGRQIYQIDARTQTVVRIHAMRR